MKKTRVLTLAALLACFATSLSAAPKACESIVVAALDASPYVERGADDQAQGPYLTLLQQTFDALDIELKWLWVKNNAAAEKEVAAGRADLLLAVPLTAERLARFDFIHPALPQDDWQVWSQKEGFVYQGWNDLRGLRGASADLADVQESFRTFASSNLDLKVVKSAQDAFAKAQDEQFDYVVYPKAFAKAVVADAQKWQQYDLDVVTQPLYLALSHQSACNDAWLRGQLALQMLKQPALDTLVKDVGDEN